MRLVTFADSHVPAPTRKLSSSWVATSVTTEGKCDHRSMSLCQTSYRQIRLRVLNDRLVLGSYLRPFRNIGADPEISRSLIQLWASRLQKRLTRYDARRKLMQTPMSSSSTRTTPLLVKWQLCSLIRQTIGIDTAGARECSGHFWRISRVLWSSRVVERTNTGGCAGADGDERRLRIIGHRAPNADCRPVNCPHLHAVSFPWYDIGRLNKHVNLIRSARTSSPSQLFWQYGSRPCYRCMQRYWQSHCHTISGRWHGCSCMLSTCCNDIVLE